MTIYSSITVYELSSLILFFCNEEKEKTILKPPYEKKSYLLSENFILFRVRK